MASDLGLHRLRSPGLQESVLQLLTLGHNQVMKSFEVRCIVSSTLVSILHKLDHLHGNAVGLRVLHLRVNLSDLVRYLEINAMISVVWLTTVPML